MSRHIISSAAYSILVSLWVLSKMSLLTIRSKMLTNRAQRRQIEVKCAVFYKMWLFTVMEITCLFLLQLEIQVHTEPQKLK